MAKPRTDVNGRPYAQLYKLKVGQFITVDGGFTCLKEGARRKIFRNETKELCIRCSAGSHVLSGQLMADNNSLIGIYKAAKRHAEGETK